MQSKLKVYTSLTLAMLCWSMTFVWYKDALVHFMPISLATLRLVFASAIFIPIVVISKKLQKIEKSDIGLFFLLGYFSLSFIFWVKARGCNMYRRL